MWRRVMPSWIVVVTCAAGLLLEDASVISKQKPTSPAKAQTVPSRTVSARPAPPQAVTPGITPEKIWDELKRLYPHNRVHDPAEQLKRFLVHPDFEVNLFASSPWVVNPVAMCWDSQNRLWVINSPMYPQALPGQRHMDFISVLEDTDADGVADKCTIFYDKLYVPTGLALGDGGVYVANQPDLLFLRDTDGDLRADEMRIFLSGFGTEDNHHAISAFRWSPNGRLLMLSGIFLHTQVETPWGIVRMDDGCTFELEPRKVRLGFFNVGTATNPWGIAFDQWGQCFLTEGPQGGIWHLNPGCVSSKPRERTPGTAAPKACGNEFIYSTHFSEKYRGLMVLNAFKNKTVNLYEFSDDGAGFATRELQPLLINSDEPYFRPVDVKIGPDGAIYIADFFQEIIGHMQYEFRDPRRDHLNGRIWRITQKGRRPLPRPRLHDLPNDQLIEQLKSPEGYIRDITRRLLYDRAADPDQQRKIAEGLRRFVQRLDPKDPNFEHHRLEALWAFQTIDVVDLPLLDAVLRSPKPEARAAAVIVLRYWLEQIPDALDRLAPLVSDPHPRVRMEALVALSYIPQARAMELAARAADFPMDRTLEYAFRHTALALRDYWWPEFQAGRLTFDGKPHRIQAALTAVRAQSVGALLALLKAGKIPADRLEPTLLLIAASGNPDELFEVFEYERLLHIFQQAGRPYDPHLHARLLDALADTWRRRTTQPREVATRLEALLQSPHPPVVAAAARLAGVWQQRSSVETLRRLARQEGTPLYVRQAAWQALLALQDPQIIPLLTEYSRPGHDLGLRLAAIAVLAETRTAEAAQALAELLTTDPGAHDLTPALEAVLTRRGGADTLVQSLHQRQLHPDAAKLALRFLHSAGIPHAPLQELLARFAGSGALSKELTKIELRQLLDEVRTKGDPFRGERVFRRKDLGCQSCHALAGAGPHVGPDLEGIGTSSPLDYIVEAVLLPQKAVREGYACVTVATRDGKIYHGVLAHKTPKEIVIRDGASRQTLSIPMSAVEELADAPSIMPQGLVDQMTRQEFLDLCRFLSELGKPGPFATPNVAVFRTWRHLQAPQLDLSQLTGEDILRLSRDPAIPWAPVYSLVSGELPLSDLGSAPLSLVQTRLDVGTPGQLMLVLNSTKGLTLWLDGQEIPLAEQTRITVSPGLHTLTFRIDKRQRGDLGLRVILENVPDSPARAQIVKGP
ncbi:MAG: HEAT repeat domain-containing protein [Gemmatales bacterium]|nr:HEAT repeat domain-containing protein [Gemmatales bacterium]MDW7993357.1 HEAT repeat domain-containing protein [Gemmatales bacterium]